MPLIESETDEAVGKNIETLEKEGKPHDQAVAIALDIQRKAKKNKKSNASDWPSMYTCRLIEPGLVDYTDLGAGIQLLKKEAIDKFVNSFIGKPVIVLHQDVNPENMARKAQGYITAVKYNSADGRYYADFLIINDRAKELIVNGYSTSTCYTATSLKEGGEWHGLKYNSEILDGVPEHLALVPNPRYELSGVPQLIINSKPANMIKEDSMVIASVKINKFETETEGIVYRGFAYYKGEQVTETLKNHPTPKAAREELSAFLKATYPLLKDEDIIEEGDRIFNAIDKSDPKMKAEFEKEKKEHPEFSDEDVWKIVADHNKEKKPNDKPKGEGGMEKGFLRKVWNAITGKLDNEAKPEETDLAKLMINVDGADVSAADLIKMKREEEEAEKEAAKSKINMDDEIGDDKGKYKIADLVACYGRKKTANAAEETPEQKKAREEKEAKEKQEKANSEAADKEKLEKEEAEKKANAEKEAKEKEEAEKKAKEEAEKKENEKRLENEKKAKNLEYFKKMNSAHETGEGLLQVLVNSIASRVARGQSKYGSTPKKQ
jgi:hypothetical protein